MIKPHFQYLFLTSYLTFVTSSYDLVTPIKELKTLTKDQIHAEVKQKNWAETRYRLFLPSLALNFNFARVEQAENCNRDKCPKLMSSCPNGGNCYGRYLCNFLKCPLRILLATGGCENDVCYCRIEISCQNKRYQRKFNSCIS